MRLQIIFDIMQFGEGHSHVHREARSGWTTPEVHLVQKKKKKKGGEERKEGRNTAVFITCPYIFPPGQGEGGTRLLLYFKGVQVHKENPRACREE